MYSTWRLCTQHNVWLNLNIKIGEHQKLYAYIIKHQNHLSIQFSLWFFIYFFLFDYFLWLFQSFYYNDLCWSTGKKRKWNCVDSEISNWINNCHWQNFPLLQNIILDRIYWLNTCSWCIKRIEKQRKKI